MHFVISVFTAVCILAVGVLFAEIFPKWFEYILAVLGSAVGGYAIAIAVRKVAMKTKWFAMPQMKPAFLIAAAITLVVVFICMTVVSKRKKKQA